MKRFLSVFFAAALGMFAALVAFSYLSPATESARKEEKAVSVKPMKVDTPPAPPPQKVPADKNALPAPVVKAPPPQSPPPGWAFGLDWKTATPAAVAKVNVRETDAGGNTPLHWAARHSKDSKVVEALIKAGADVTAKSARGYTPFDLAKKNKSLSGTPAYWELKYSAQATERAAESEKISKEILEKRRIQWKRKELARKFKKRAQRQASANALKAKSNCRQARHQQAAAALQKAITAEKVAERGRKLAAENPGYSYHAEVVARKAKRAREYANAVAQSLSNC